MTVQVLTKQIHHLVKQMRRSARPHTLAAKRQAHGLALVQGLWQKKPRTARDLARVRRALWG